MIQPIKKSRKRNTVGFKEDLLTCLITFITNSEDYCLNNALDELGITECEKKQILSLIFPKGAAKKATNIHWLPDFRSSPSSSGNFPSRRK